jgi:nicotinamide riboside kinase
MPALFCNILGGPGTGKSTVASGVFCKLKLMGFNAEYIQEYAKDKTWEKNRIALDCQPYIMGKQLFRQYRLMDQVEIAVTDTSLLLANVYKTFGVTPSYEKTTIEQFNLFDNMCIFLVRNTDAHPYNPKGRSQNEDEAKELDAQILELLIDNHIPFHTVRVAKDDSTVNTCVELIQRKLTNSE